MGTGNVDYRGYEKSPGYDYYYNICKSSTTPEGDVRGFGACQYVPGTKTFVASLGTWNNVQWSLINPSRPYYGARATIVDGDRCYIKGQWIPRTLNVNLICSVKTKDTFNVTEDVGTCVFNFNHEVDCQLGAQNCVFVDFNNKLKFDLNKLRNQTRDYVGSDSAYNYVLNVCGPSVSSSMCARNKQAICQLSPTGEFSAGMGSFEVQPRETYQLLSATDPSRGLALKFTNGDWCYIQGQRVPRQTTVSFICDPSRPDEPVIEVASSAANCTYNIKHYSHSICTQPASEQDLGKLTW